MVLPAAALQSRLEQLVVDAKSPGAIAGVSVRGAAPMFVVSGQDPHTHQQLRTSDPFRIASITKTFVAALALRLVQHGRLGLDDPVSRFVPDWPNGTAITVRMLLAHTSGIPPFGSDTGSPGPYADAADQFALDNYGKFVSPEQVLAFVRDRPLLFPPGTATSYSNINTILLGQIVTTVSGRPLVDDLHADLLDPLGLADSRYAPAEPVSPIAGLSDLSGSGTAVDTGAIDWTGAASIDGAAGGMVSTIPDLVRWGDALMRRHAVVTDPLARDAFRIQPGGTGLGVLGYSTTNFVCVFAQDGCPPNTDFTAIAAAGSFEGARSLLVYDPKSDTLIAAMVNRDGTPGLEAFARDILAMVDGGAPSPHSS
jgi:D-alanyl-D-alanine carboxypeptidase